MLRDTIEEETFQKVLADLAKHFSKKLKQKGSGAFVSRKEIVGVVDEEIQEVKVESHARNDKDLEIELFDLAVGALWGISSMRTW